MVSKHAPTPFPIRTDSDHEEVLLCSDPTSGYLGVLAIHSTVLGPAVGGTRLWPYASVEEAVADALRLSRGMTYKAAMARLPLGGGKSVILSRSPRQGRKELFRAHGRLVESLGGRYITAEDVGTGPRDMQVVRTQTRHVAGLQGVVDDPAPFTARGVLRAMQAAAMLRWSSDDLRGKTVAVQGYGRVGSQLVRELRDVGAVPIVTDLDPRRVRRAVREHEAEVVSSDGIYDVEADILAPCALGAVLDFETVARLRVEIVVGAANNQLRDADAGAHLADRGILYVPDYLANAGGVISGCSGILGWSRLEVSARIDSIYETTLKVLRRAAEEALRPEVVADRIAEKIIDSRR